MPETLVQNRSPEALEGLRVLITGAARGLGAEFAKAVIQSGARVVLADVLALEGQALATQLGERAHFVSVDLRSSASTQAMVERAAQWLGGLDAVINNAAITNSGGVAMQDLNEAVWDDVMAVNVRAPWLVSKFALPFLEQSPHARIVNLSSDTALWGAPNLMAYVASKGAVMAMTRSMARELGAKGITVNAIAPGLTLVEATQYVPPHRHEHYMKGRAIPRAQVPDDLSSAVLFLLSPASGFITGQVIPINGGFVMN
jgi:NAD(P)-dependent dehydrogenase (short-subunit alcohol dehydrogenase family)